MKRFLHIDSVDGGYIYTAESEGKVKAGYAPSILEAVAVTKGLADGEVAPTSDAIMRQPPISVYQVAGGYVVANDGMLGMKVLKVLSGDVTIRNIAEAIELEFLGADSDACAQTEFPEFDMGKDGIH